MARCRARRLLPLLTFVTLGMILGSLLQLALLHRLDDPSHLVHVDNDPEATVLRLGYVKPEVISWTPRIIVFHNFLSSEECDYLMAIARPRLQVSTVVDVTTGKGVKSDVRTSSGMFVNSEERKSAVIQAIEKRISVFSQIPKENGELIQVLRYEASQYYRPHHDYFSDTFNLKRGGQRVATMLMYLTDGVEGGETHFPQLAPFDPTKKKKEEEEVVIQDPSDDVDKMADKIESLAISETAELNFTGMKKKKKQVDLESSLADLGDGDDTQDDQAVDDEQGEGILLGGGPGYPGI